MLFSRLGAIAAIAILSAGPAMAQPEGYMVNLGPVARNNDNQYTAVGRGTIDVAVSGNKLTFNGKFSGLASPATDAHLCIGVGIGVQGTCGKEEVVVTRADTGTLSGTVTINAAQAKALKAGQLYVQLNSQKAPAPVGTLWGWLLVAHEEVGPNVPQQGHWFLPQYDMPLSAEHGSVHQNAPNS